MLEAALCMMPPVAKSVFQLLQHPTVVRSLAATVHDAQTAVPVAIHTIMPCCFVHPPPPNLQERTLYERGDHRSWGRQYYLPATADVAVMAWRRWLDKFGDTLPVLPQTAADLPPSLPREQIFDR